MTLSMGQVCLQAAQGIWRCRERVATLLGSRLGHLPVTADKTAALQCIDIWHDYGRSAVKLQHLW